MHHRILSRLVVLALVCFLPAFVGRAADVPVLAPKDAAARVASGAAVLVDVREAAEWKETGVVATAQTLALSDLRGERAAWKAFLAANRDKEIILYCRSGNRSGQAAKLLAAEGFKTANAGALKDWIAAGQPTRKVDEAAKP